MGLKNKLPVMTIALTLILAVIGLIFIYAASNYYASLTFGDAFYYVKKQAIALAVGTVCMVAGRYVPKEILLKGRWWIFAVSVLLLGLVFIPGLGVESYGATRWLNLGFTTIQPSEISKFGFVIFLAGELYLHPPTTLYGVAIPVLAGAVVCALVLAEPNMSITAVIGFSLIAMLFVSGLPKKYLLVGLAAVLAAGVGLIFAEPYRMERLRAFLNPWEDPKGEGYQLIQSYYAIANGGLFGVGLFKSRQKYLFLPFSESDFIFSVIAEETGLFGALIVILLFLALIGCGVRAALRAQDRYRALLSWGLVSIVALQTAVNLAVVSGCIPPTGVPLPYVSAGGTSLISFMFVSGLLSGTEESSFLRKKGIVWNRKSLQKGKNG